MKKFIFLFEVVYYVLYFIFLDFFLTRIDYMEFLLGGINDLTDLYIVFFLLALPTLFFPIIRGKRSYFLVWLILFVFVVAVIWLLSGMLYHTQYLNPTETIRYIKITGYIPNIALVGNVLYVYSFLFWVMPLMLPSKILLWGQRRALMLLFLCFSFLCFFWLVPSPIGRLGGRCFCRYYIYNEDIYVKLERMDGSIRVEVSNKKDFSQEESILLLSHKTKDLFSFYYYHNGYVDVSKYDSVYIVKGVNCSQIGFYPDSERIGFCIDPSNLILDAYIYGKQRYGERRVVPY